MAWTEGTIGAALARQTFKGGLVVVPNCTWTGHECDLLVVTEKLMLVDVEVKISRADLKADAKKDKWWRRTATWRPGETRPDPVHRDWPPKVWKHYYALPRAIWKPELMDILASTASGVILLGTERHPDQFVVDLIRKPQPNRDAKPIDAGSVAAIARLASLRMWDSFRAMDAMNEAERGRREAAALAESASIAKQ